MAAPRKSAQQVAAREKARAKAQELTERHERLIDLAAGFFEQQDQAEQIRAEARERADQILAKAEDDAASALAEAGAKVQQMLDTGESRAAVAARLGLSGAEVKRAVDGANISTSTSESVTSESADEEMHGTASTETKTGAGAGAGAGPGAAGDVAELDTAETKAA